MNEGIVNTIGCSNITS